MSAAATCCATATGTRYRSNGSERVQAGAATACGLYRESFVNFRLLSALAAVPVLIAAAPASAPGQLGQVQQHLQSVQSMTANFTQTDRVGKVLTGVVTLKKPGKIRFQYEKGVPILIVGDGKALTFIDYSVRQVQRWPIGNSPLSVLLNPDRDMTRFAKVIPGADPRIISVEANDPKHPEYGRITLVFVRNASAPGGLMLQGWVALDSQNNRTTIRLTNQRFNAAISDGAFRWNDPRRNSGPR
ncbi:outer membrane lipoprotein carrier protein LolA [Sphingomonas sp. So64.6b]|nr:outer membrane lipoprotein carrier protein LolA [Sphingomonas sp. So64.6b]